MRIYVIICIVFLIGCTHPAKIVSPDKTLTKRPWTKDELKSGFAMHTLGQTENASHHVIRLVDNEEPHVHQHHDLAVTILSGKGKVHFKEHSVDLRPGDVVLIPAGYYHWAENNDPDGTEVLVTFTPPFDGKDTVPVK